MGYSFPPAISMNGGLVRSYPGLVSALRHQLAGSGYTVEPTAAPA
jgi:hypothetical protein